MLSLLLLCLASQHRGPFRIGNADCAREISPEQRPNWISTAAPPAGQVSREASCRRSIGIGHRPSHDVVRRKPFVHLEVANAAVVVANACRIIAAAPQSRPAIAAVASRFAGIPQRGAAKLQVVERRRPSTHPWPAIILVVRSTAIDGMLTSPNGLSAARRRSTKSSDKMGKSSGVVLQRLFAGPDVGCFVSLWQAGRTRSGPLGQEIDGALAVNVERGRSQRRRRPEETGVTLADRFVRRG